MTTAPIDPRPYGGNASQIGAGAGFPRDGLLHRQAPKPKP